MGDHIRPRFRIPESWHWPVGVSLSNEIGYQRPEFSADSWTWEIRPIVDKKVGRWYLSFNPTLDRSFHGPGVNQGVVFSSNFKFSYDITKRILAGWSITVRGDRSRTSVHSTISNSSSFLPLTSIWVQSGSSTLAWASAQPLPPIKCIIRRRFS